MLQLIGKCVIRKVLLATLFILLTALVFKVTVTVSLIEIGQSYAAEALTPSAYLPLVMKQPTPTPVPQPDWLIYVNQHRNLAELDHLAENESWSDGGWLHSRYMIKNDVITHYEDASNPWYTLEGYEAGRYGNVFVSSSTLTSDEMAIDYWMTAPFHAVAIIDPELETTGFGSYREAIGSWRMGATLDVGRGRTGGITEEEYPVMYPSANKVFWLTQFYGNEWPDPLEHCSYTAPTGPPIIIQVGNGSKVPNVSSHSISSGGQYIAHCLIHETNFVNSDSYEQYIGRIVLDIRDAVILLPRYPFQSGKYYQVAITINSSEYTWSFQVNAAARPTSMNDNSDYFEFSDIDFAVR